MIEAQELSRRYGPFTAVDRISFAVEEGEIVGILGPNGAGKTTTIRMITGFLPPSAGRVTVFGKDLFAEPRKARRDIGYLPENVTLYPEMRVIEYLAYRARLEGMPRGEARQAIGEAIERALLGDVERQIIGTLSKGYRQRVGLATAILHHPRVLVLDEPTVGLDPKQIIAIRELIRELGRKHTLLLSTHILPEVELLCDRVLIIDRGRIVAQGTPAELHATFLGRYTLSVELRLPHPAGAADGDGTAAEAVAASLAALPGVESAEVIDDGAATAVHRFRLAVAADADPREEVFRAAVANGWMLRGLAEERGSLEDVFVRLTTRDEPATAPPERPPPAPPAETAAAAGPDETGETGEEEVS